MSECRGRGCGRPCNEFLCGTCTEELAAALDGMPWLLEQLTVTELRQDRISRGLRSGSRPVAPLLFNLEAGNLRVALDNAVTTWARHIAETRKHPGPRGTAADAAIWLGEHVMSVRLDEAAGELHADITRTVEAGIIAINPPPMLVYRGPCPTIVGRTPTSAAIGCMTPLYADRSELFVNCPYCNVRHDVARLEQALLAHIGHRVFDVPALVRILRELGEPVSRNTIVSWIHRGKLQPRAWRHGTRIVPRRLADTDKPLYRLNNLRKLRQQTAQAKGSTA